MGDKRTRVSAVICKNMTEPDVWGEVYSKEALAEMAKDAPGLPVTVNFSGPVVGEIKNARVVEAEGVTLLMAGVEIDSDVLELVMKAGLRFAVGGKVLAAHSDGDHSVLDRIEIMEVSLVASPAGPSLPAFKIEDEP
jgi:hypothetical protein